MRVQHIISIIILLILWKPLPAQENTGRVDAGGTIHTSAPDTLIQTVLNSNRALLAAQEKYRVSVLQARTGITPPDPKVELGYLYGKPAEMGNRIDFSVTQEIDFPTAYVYRSRTRDLEISQAALNLTLVRQEVVLEANRLWIERVYLNGLERMLEERLELARQLIDQFEQSVSLGETGQLALSQSNLQAMALRGELEKVKTDIRANEAAILEVTGGVALAVSDTLLPSSRPIDPDSLMSAYREGPMMQYFRQEVDRREQMQSLATSLRLPKITTGYYSESVAAEQFRGFLVGISVPLWEHANRIDLARTEVRFAEADVKRASLQVEREVQQKIEQWKSLDRIIREMETALSRVNDIELLKLAWKGGEISLAEYMMGTDLYFRNIQSLHTYIKEQLLVEAELRKVFY
ncbi:MAG: TolC family protein [Bacteroidales bacterium]